MPRCRIRNLKEICSKLVGDRIVPMGIILSPVFVVKRIQKNAKNQCEKRFI